MALVDVVKRLVNRLAMSAGQDKARSDDVAKEASFLKKLSDQSAAETRPLVLHRRSEVVKEHGRRPPPRLNAVPYVLSSEDIHVRRKRDIIEESLEIAMKTKRRDTAESRLQLVEELLDELVDVGHESADDRINRHTLGRLREGLDRRFSAKSRK
jgi:hypothetical protein